MENEQYFYERELDRIVDSWQNVDPYRVGKFAEQYLRQGFSDEDTWDLHVHLAELILPRLKRFKEVARTRVDLQLDEVIEAFEVVIKYNGSTLQISGEDWDKFHKGMKSFGEIFMRPWW